MAYQVDDLTLLRHLLDLGERFLTVTDGHDQRIAELESAEGESGIYYNTTAHWNSQRSYIPKAGHIVIYSDYAKENEKNVPNFKIGDGKAYLIDLPFSQADLRATVMAHINNTAVHLSQGDREKLENSVTASVTGENLVLSK